MKGKDIIVAVDLDGTLVRSDLLHENIMYLLSHGWWVLLRAAIALFSGKAAFKSELSEGFELDPASLPYRDEVIDRIKERQSRGQQVILVSASDQRLVNSVSSFLGCFDAAYGSDGQRNLAGAAKAEFLVREYGERGFDYIGDAPIDLPVWARARQAITVGARSGLRRRVEAIATEVEHLAPPIPSYRYYLKALRPHQWVKNVLIFVPLAAAHQFYLGDLAAAALAFVAFSLAASSVYILNDLLDLKADRLHPRKRSRPFASGVVPISHGVAMAAILLALAIGVSLSFLSPVFLVVITVYYASTVAYSFSFKRKMIVDICTLAGLYTLRVLAGGAAIGVMISPWLLAFSMFLFLALAALKRQTELIGGQEAGISKIAGRNYEVGDLPVVTVIAIAAGFNAVLVLALYFSSPDISELYSMPIALWGICPIVLYWISRLVMMTQRGFMTDDPIVFAMRDSVSLVCGGAALACATAAILL